MQQWKPLQDMVTCEKNMERIDQWMSGRNQELGLIKGC